MNILLVLSECRRFFSKSIW